MLLSTDSRMTSYIQVFIFNFIFTIHIQYLNDLMIILNYATTVKVP